MPHQRAGSPRNHIDVINTGVRTVSKSSVWAASKVVAGSAATTTCSAIVASNVGIVDSISMQSVPDVVIAPVLARLAAHY